jgi:hypothetical protein
MTADKSEDQQDQILDFLPEAELLAIPESNFSPGVLAAIWERKAAFKEEQAETDLIIRHDRLQQRAELSREHDGDRQHAETLFRQRMLEVEERSERLLQRAQEEELLAREHLNRVESHALVLGDGRRAYVDGKDNFRDESGATLRDGDKEEASRLHAAHPDASTWSEHTEAVQRQENAQQLREKVEKLRQDAAREDGKDLSTDQLDAKGKDYVRRLSNYENDLQTLADKNAGGSTHEQVTDDTLGGSDYMAAYGGTDRTTSYAAKLDTAPRTATVSKDFAAAAAGQGAPVKPVPAGTAPATPGTAPSA